MKTIKINFLRKRIDPALKKDILAAASLVMQTLKQDQTGLEMNIEFIDEKEMQSLNNRMRGIDQVTDVLSFPNNSLAPYETISGGGLVGDVAICVERAKQQAEEYGNTFEEEIIKLVVHSTLHLMGFDHIKDSDFAVMNKVENEVLKKFQKQKS